MKFIKNNHVGIRKSAIVLQPAKQDSLGYVADSRAGARDIIKTDLVTNLGTENGTALISHPRSYGPGGHSAGLENDDFFRRQTTIQEDLRHLGGFA